MAAQRSTLLTSPTSFADFLFRLAFFSLAPFAIVVVAQLFPVRGALIDVGLALAVFVSSEAAHRLARRWRAVDLLISQALEFESFNAERPPRPFAYYVFYPLLFPYWLWSRPARREFLVFRSFRRGRLTVLLLAGLLSTSAALAKVILDDDALFGSEPRRQRARRARAANRARATERAPDAGAR